MKALSIQQPYSFAITMGFKPVENRDWKSTNPGLRFRGPVMIHAGKVELKDDVDGVLRQIATQTNQPLSAIEDGYKKYRGLGGIVGAANITDCVRAHRSEWFFGPYAFVMERPLWSELVPLKGALGFFEVPHDVFSAVTLHPYNWLSR